MKKLLLATAALIALSSAASAQVYVNPGAGYYQFGPLVIQAPPVYVAPPPPVIVQPPPVVVQQPPPVVVQQPPVVVQQPPAVVVQPPPPQVPPIVICHSTVSDYWGNPGFLNVRASPNGYILGQVWPNDALQLVGPWNEWVTVVTPWGATGWVYSAYLRCN